MTTYRLGYRLGELLGLADELNQELECSNSRDEQSGRRQFTTPSEAARMTSTLIEPDGDIVDSSQIEHITTSAEQDVLGRVDDHSL